MYYTPLLYGLRQRETAICTATTLLYFPLAVDFLQRRTNCIPGSTATSLPPRSIFAGSNIGSVSRGEQLFIFVPGRGGGEAASQLSDAVAFLFRRRCSADAIVLESSCGRRLIFAI